MTVLRTTGSAREKTPAPEITFMARDLSSAKTLAECIIKQDRFKGPAADEATLVGPASAPASRWTSSSGWDEALEPVT
ncbi:hypothetical protein LK10_12610 [Sinomonas humi]|uniref:Uncharacterized protein n=1 Tax=Sinomonas humi TaxID=1338436 RepID=A0A0B2AKN9_9MICC|nr:hypothetical protein LK10_12610 [Sinomonas humi]